MGWMGGWGGCCGSRGRRGRDGGDPSTRMAGENGATHVITRPPLPLTTLSPSLSLVCALGQGYVRMRCVNRTYIETAQSNVLLPTATCEEDPSLNVPELDFALGRLHMPGPGHDASTDHRLPTLPFLLPRRLSYLLACSAETSN